MFNLKRNQKSQHCVPDTDLRKEAWQHTILHRAELLVAGRAEETAQLPETALEPISGKMAN